MSTSNRLLNLLLRSFIVLFVSVCFVGCGSDDSPNFMENENEVPVVKPEDRLPQISINTNGNTIVDEPKTAAQMRISKTDVVSFDGLIGIEFRGATSQMFPKKSFGIETWDENSEGIDVPLLGLPEEEDWILYAPYTDKSLMRNMLIYDLSREMGRYASRSQFVEVTLNGVYQGVYVFMEKLKRDGQRIAINKLNMDENSGENLTGGYILKIDKTAGNNLGEGYNPLNSFASPYSPLNSSIGQKINFLYEDPKAEDITPEQKEYIGTYITNFENVLSADDFANTDTGYAQYIDVASFIDFFLLNELSNNVDGYRLSTFMYKDKNGKLNMGPIWDFNLAFGNANYCNGGDTNVWAYKFNERCPEDFWQVPFWWDRLLQDPLFVGQLKGRWETLRDSVLSETAIFNRIGSYKAVLEKAGASKANFETWPILGVYIWPNNYVGTTYTGEIEYLNSWIGNRLSWMDAAINQL